MASVQAEEPTGDESRPTGDAAGQDDRPAGTSTPTPDTAKRHRADGSRAVGRGVGETRLRGLLWLLAKDTLRACMTHRVTGLAAEAAFFTLLSLPPLLLGLVGMLGYLDGLIGTGTIDGIRHNIITASRTMLSDTGVNQLVRPLLDSAFRRGRPDVISLGFLIALWSGSRAMNVFVDTITIMYGLDGRRGMVRTRLLAFLLYLVALVLGTVVLPLVVAGPDLVVRAVPQLADTVHVLYWPSVVLLSVIFLTTLYHLSVPVRTPWRDDMPGALVALPLWLLGSAALRLYLANAVEGPTVYGSLAAPVAVLLWLGVTALTVLIGAAVNAAVDRIWPYHATADARAEAERMEEAAARELISETRHRRRQAENVAARSRDTSEDRAGAESDEQASAQERSGSSAQEAAGDASPAQVPELPQPDPPPAERPERWAPTSPDTGQDSRVYARLLRDRRRRLRERLRKRGAERNRGHGPTGGPPRE